MQTKTRLFIGGIVAIVLALILRAVTLENPDLMDTTEGRYASISLQMLTSGDFLTPQIPVVNSYEPYYGKPPLHFWMIAGSYALFGVDEWTGRLPSFLALCLIVFSIAWFGCKYPSTASNTTSESTSESSSESTTRTITGLFSALIAVSSPILFLSSGAVILDVTLTAAITIALLSLFILTTNNPLRGWFRWAIISAFWIALAIGFLVKGPIVLVSVALPIFAWICLPTGPTLKQVVHSVSLFIGSVIFFSLTLPWFFLLEAKHAGFLRYFFLHENLLRYFVSNYGDRYGQGHMEPYGTAWLMFAIGFLPWSIFLIGFLLRDFWRGTFVQKLQTSPLFSFSIAWTLSTLVFLTFIRQLHTGYLVPVIPGAALLLAQYFSFESQRSCALNFQRIVYLAALVLTGLSVAGLVIGGSVLWSLLALVSALMFAAAARLSLRHLDFRVSMLASPITVVLLLVFFIQIGSPVADGIKSSEKILLCVANHSADPNTHVGVVSSRAYSALMLSEAWASELPHPLQITLIPGEEASTSTLDDLVLRARDYPLLSKDFQIFARYGDWLWVKRSTMQGEVIICKDDEVS